MKYYCNLYNFPYDLRRVCVNLQVDGYRNLTYDKRNSIRNMVIATHKSAEEDFSLYHYDTQFEDGFFSFLFFGEKAIYSEILTQSAELSEKI